MVEQVVPRYELRNRYKFTGRLVMQTALHIGGGKVTLSHSDSPVVLTPENIPFIPGSSFKGALRSTVEKLVPNLPANANLFSCGLIELDEEAEQEERKQGRKVCSTARQKAIVKERREKPGQAAEILKSAIDSLCSTCQLFGSPYAASCINVSDLYMPLEEWSGIIQVRDGVAIDRDSEKAKDRLKYDFEVVPASAVFNLEITLENATQQDLQILCVGLSDFVHGFGAIGGKRSRGLGACRLEGLQVSMLELIGEGISESERDRRLKNYLLKREFSSIQTGEEFLETYINTIFR
jgi:CRISPR-associated RAMP protein (TIGR02581 family)